MPIVFYLTIIFLKKSQRKNHQTRLHNSDPNWAWTCPSKGNLLEKLTNITFVFYIPSCYIISKKFLSEQIVRFHNFCPNFPLPQKGIFFENWRILIMSIGLHYAKIFLKISGAVNTSYIILVQIGPIFLQKDIFFENWLTLLFTMYCAALCHKISKKIL